MSMKKLFQNVLLFIATVTLAVLFGNYLAYLYGNFKSHSKNGDFTAYVEKMPFQITLYGTSTCEYCKLTREHLRNSGIKFNDLKIDASKTAEKTYALLNEKNVPVLVTKDRIVVGFYPKEFDELTALQRSK